MTDGVLRREVAACFEPLLEPARYKGAWGGRGGGKDHFFCEQMLEDSLYYRSLRSLCVREIQKTLSQSVKLLLEMKLAKFQLGHADGFRVFNDCIETPGDGLISFTGMQDHNAESVKSFEAADRLYWTEAQVATARSLGLLRPTIRKKDSELWFAWNPKLPFDKKRPEDSVDGLLRGPTPPPRTIVVEAQYTDNPWFHETEMVDEEAYDRAHRQPEDYEHIWRGAYETRSGARVFKNWKVAEFELAPRSRAVYRFGADFGFSIDPTVLVRMFIGRWEKQPDALGLGGIAVPDENGRILFIDYEAYRIGCDLDFTPALFAGTQLHPDNSLRWHNPHSDVGIPDALRWKITADSSNPQSISYLSRQGFNIVGAIKGPGSIEEGVEFLKAYSIVIHPRCPHTEHEFTYYSFKTDPKNENNILPVLEDKKNHVIDACRYALEDVRKGRGFFG